MPDAIQAHVSRNEARFLDELVEFLRIPSISPLPEYQSEVRRAAEFVAAQFAAARLENIRLIPGSPFPLVYADWVHAPGKPTVLCYGHYDVQPPDPLDLWTTPPFEPVVANGALFARGAAENKGQMFTHIKAVQTLFELAGTLPVNVKFLIEGEEEIGGATISTYLSEHAPELAADVSLISDSSLYASGLPTLVTGLRGLVYLEIEATGPARDLHSGLYGGAAPNAVFGLVELLSKMKGRDGEIAIPGFYDDVAEPSPDELASWARLPFNEQEFSGEMGVTAFAGEAGYPVLERVWSRPSFEVHGVAGGFTGSGAKTVIPARATAKCSFRIVPDQDPEQVVSTFRTFVADHVPAGIQLQVNVLSAAPGWSIDTGSKAIRAARSALATAFGVEPALIRSGASIPIVADLAARLNVPAVVMGFSDPDDGVHAPNEKFALHNFYSGIAAVARFLELYGDDD
jgi:acetylornithine deacetylase/succinyl-diaminopimelate desuccinylase-like protein